MSKIDEYRAKKSGFENLDNVVPYGNVGVGYGGNMPEYTITLKTNCENPQCSWFFEAIRENWEAIRTSMKVIGAADVNRSKGEAAKEAGDFLGLVPVGG